MLKLVCLEKSFSCNLNFKNLQGCRMSIIAKLNFIQIFYGYDYLLYLPFNKKKVI